MITSRFNAEDQLRAAEAVAAADSVTASALLHNKVIELTASYFDVRQRWTPSLKRRLTVIAETDPRFHAQLAEFYAGDFTSQLAIALEMIALVYDSDR